jgi:hypothetical protein
MAKFYFTMQMKSEHANEYVEIEGEDYWDARKIMFEYFGSHWAFQYTEKDFEGQPEKYHLTCMLRLPNSMYVVVNKDSKGLWRDGSNSVHSHILVYVTVNEQDMQRGFVCIGG